MRVEEVAEERQCQDGKVEQLVCLLLEQVLLMTQLGEESGWREREMRMSAEGEAMAARFMSKLSKHHHF